MTDTTPSVPTPGTMGSDPLPPHAFLGHIARQLRTHPELPVPIGLTPALYATDTPTIQVSEPEDMEPWCSALAITGEPESHPMPSGVHYRAGGPGDPIHVTAFRLTKGQA